MRGVAVVMMGLMLLVSCSDAGSDGPGEHGRPLSLTPPPVPAEPQAIVELHGFHEGTMTLPQPTSVRWEPDDGLLEVNFVSDDGGQLFVRGREVDGTTPGTTTILFEVAEHVSAPNKTTRRYQASDGECELTLESPVEVGTEVVGTFVCHDVRGQDLTGAFRTGLGAPDGGRTEAAADG